VKTRVFLDTAFVLASTSQTDQHHAQAVDCARRMHLAGTRVVTTHAVLLEIGNALAKQRYRSSAIQAILARHAWAELASERVQPTSSTTRHFSPTKNAPTTTGSMPTRPTPQSVVALLTLLYKYVQFAKAASPARREAGLRIDFVL